MIVKSKSRGDAIQLADYLMDKRENEKVELLGIDGTATPNDLKRSLLEMELTVELTNGTKGLHHAQIAPRDFESATMSREDWLHCIDTYAHHTGHAGQKWAAVLHTKNGGTHAHVVFERYNHDTGQLIRDSFNYYKNNQARQELEKHFGHQATPWRRDKEHELDHKKTLTKIWDYSEDGVDFIEQVESIGYQVAKGLDRRPYKVITPDRKSLDLVKQLDGVYTADVRKAFRDIELQTEAEALRKVMVEKKQEIAKKRVEFVENKSEIQVDELKQEPESLYEQLLRKQRELEQQMKQNGLDQGMNM